jgi:leucyl/phenylalanyl-tRNA--protein transferase
MRAQRKKPVWIEVDSVPFFPSPEGYDPHGLIAGGGDLSPARLLAAYAAGIFPWYDDPPILWWSPDPRTLIERTDLHVSRSMRRTLASKALKVTMDHDLPGVLDGCADRAEGTWLSDEMRIAYRDLAAQGYLHSYEVWHGHDLIGGLYGVLLGSLFAAESMFHRERDASKVALITAVLHTAAAGVGVFDVQFMTPHLQRMGARELPRSLYLKRVGQAVAARTHWPEAADSNDLLPWVVSQLGPVVRSAANGAERG